MVDNMEIKSAEFIKGIKGTDSILEDGIPQVAFIGRSNVGKSSTINVLVSRKSLVKTSSKPGKTREINFFLINKEIYFVDLPGYGFAKLALRRVDKLQKHILWYLETNEITPKYVVVIVDAKVGLTELDKEFINFLNELGHKIIIVANKIDKLKKNDISKQINNIKKEVGDIDVFPFSAKKKIGRQELIKILFS